VTGAITGEWFHVYQSSGSTTLISDVRKKLKLLFL
jgi:hypothetical protein